MGDVFGRPGRQAVRQVLPALIADLSLELVIANGENAAGGKGITAKEADELFQQGVRVITSGNHIFRHLEVVNFLAKEPCLLRPANYPAQVPGVGSVVVPLASGSRVGVINVEGRVYMNNRLEDPFLAARREVERLSRETPLLLLDFHAEATSEKRAMGFYLDGKVSAVIGTHTHVQTADEQILPGGTGYITDAGMTGASDSVIGLEPAPAIDHFLTQMPIKFVVAQKNVYLQGVLLELETGSGRCLKIERLSLPV